MSTESARKAVLLVWAAGAGLGCSLVVDLEGYEGPPVATASGSAAGGAATSSATGTSSATSMGTAGAGTGAAGAGGGGGSGATGTGGSTLCKVGGAGSPADTLVDDFEAGAINSASWTLVDNGDASTIAQTGGHLVVTVDDGFAGIESKDSYDLTGKGVLIEVIEIPAEGQTRLRLGDDNCFLEFLINDGNVISRSQDGKPPATSETIPFDPSSHHWLRIREGGGAIHWEGSLDANAWGTLRSEQNPIPVTSMKIKISGNNMGPQAPATAEFDNLNKPP